ncbi:hypothetical protein CLG94_10305 [Candidatus Methylomirabilis limnetica]|uniref:Reverse transcriptase domain-containing protein n=1 Tax=Candidatus Methylomirabilis limnetica TaxID=2033718 RepID=A0A2T4TW00_9BACT|nr:RNA-directed DNA polymerase [Candidatus Methylomirabilis limnetica]PTL35290.1 hypothetical protein CLG94_10305 [Candidatus Methylomirabilis limnetica]
MPDGARLSGLALEGKECTSRVADLGALIARGYFARELPPPFTTKPFASLAASRLTVLPAAFHPNPPPPFSSQIAVHNLARPGSLRRRLGIPNPVSFSQIASLVAAHWQTIVAHCVKSPISLTSPQVDASGKRAIDRKAALSDRPIHRARVQSTSRVILRADISQFYPSLYTHSVPWALHFKAVAKIQKTSTALLGNMIDRCLRNAQDQQTIGIPIGPDTSLVIAEVVLTAADVLLAKQVALNGFRYIDDYELGFASYSDAERALSILQGVLNEFELQLNPTKTRIIDLPSPVDSPWSSELRIFSFRPGVRSQRYDLIRYFDRSFELASANPGDPVLRYAISRASSLIVAPSNWALFQHLLLQAACSEPGTLPFAIEQLKRYVDAGYKLDTQNLHSALHNILADHAPRGHGSEVAWALWGLLLFGLPLDDYAMKAVSTLEDVVVALLALDLRSKGQASRTTSLAQWEQAMTADELRGRLWLLSYEANLKGWLPSVGGGDHVAADPNFQPLKAAGVYFYDEQAHATYTPRRPIPTGEEMIPVSGPPEEVEYF